MLQVLALLAMEAPNANQHELDWAKKLGAFEAIRSANPAKCVRGQYDPGYRDIPDVAEDSQVETYAALGSWRSTTGAGPGRSFYLRTGKNLPVKHTEVRVCSKAAAPHRSRDEVPQAAAQPDGRADRPVARGKDGLRRQGRRSRRLRGSRSRRAREGAGAEPEPYELLDDAIHGRYDLFTKFSMVEETWRS